MRITWNGTDVDHSTLVFFDEISTIPHRLLRKDPFGDIDMDDSGALVCRYGLSANQNWYLADGTLTDDTFGSFRINTYHTREKARPDYARLNRKIDRYQYPRSVDHNGLWSCRWGELGQTSGAAFVGVFERNYRSKLDERLGTGYELAPIAT